MPKIFTSKNQKIGEIGEDVASIYLSKLKFDIIERNYTRKWGEIDIIAMKAKKLYFVEVKAVSCSLQYASRVTSYRPEENMHPMKLKKIYRTIEIYLMDKRLPDNIEWQLDLLCVYLDQINKKAKIKRIENIVG
jgi:putative endonuclease